MKLLGVEIRLLLLILPFFCILFSLACSHFTLMHSLFMYLGMR